MQGIIQQVEAGYKKSKVVDVKSGDTVRVHQKIKEGNKERIQVFEGLVIKTSKMNSHTATIHVRRIASGVGVEKSYRLHSPLVVKVEVVKRAKVRRNYLSYMRKRSGKSARLGSVAFDKDAVNDVSVPVDESKAAHEAEEALKEEQSKEEPKVEAEEKPVEEAEKTEEPAAEKNTDDKAEEKTTDKADKAAEKKAKAEEFRKAQESK